MMAHAGYGTLHIQAPEGVPVPQRVLNGVTDPCPDCVPDVLLTWAAAPILDSRADQYLWTARLFHDQLCPIYQQAARAVVTGDITGPVLVYGGDLHMAMAAWLAPELIVAAATGARVLTYQLGFVVLDDDTRPEPCHYPVYIPRNGHPHYMDVLTRTLHVVMSLALTPTIVKPRSTQ